MTELRMGDVVQIPGVGRAIATGRADRVLIARAGDFERSIGNFASVRPLVVIDPEDRGQVERLLTTLADRQLLSDEPIDFLLVNGAQAALREFANPTPPKPDEPTDPSVRVRAAGTTWARVGSWWITPDVTQVSRQWDYLTDREDFAFE